MLALFMVTLILAGGFLYVWRDVRQRTPQAGYTITARRIEHSALGVYLRMRGAEVTEPIDADNDTDVTFVVEPGDSLHAVSARLQSAGLVVDAQLFRWVVQYQGTDTDIQAGTYTLRPNMTMDEIAEVLQHGRVPAQVVSIPEGWRAEEIAWLLEQHNITSAEEFLRVVREGESDMAFVHERSEESPGSLEGFLFPDTYQFVVGTTPERVLEIMLETWDRRIPADLRQNAAEYDLTLYEVVTLASIVEREARVAQERPLMAGVFLNRLRLGMTLGADPTVQYAKGFSENEQTWWSQLTLADLEIVSPYNTYVNAGLPPGPICNPGQAAIRAVLEPEETEYLFFYHKGDGTHAFAVTYEEHLRNIATYRDRQ
jgi:UPF0755 protein